MPKISRRNILSAGAAAPIAAAVHQSAGTMFAQVAAAPATSLKIVTMNAFEPAEVAKIVGATPVKVNFVIAKDRADFRAQLRDADAVYGDVQPAELDLAPKLKWIQSGAAGMEGMPDQLKKHPVIVTNYARTFAHGISETAMGLLLCLTRGIAKYYMPQFYKQRTMRSMGTVKSDHHTELVGRTMGIVGMGGIGTMVARRAYYGFDMKVIGIDLRPVPQQNFVAEMHDPTYLMEMAKRVDVLVSAAPATPLTNKMFNETVFRAMKPSAHFIALSRGSLFDDMALVKALKEKWIAGAGLEVFPVEPPPSTHPIFDCENVVMSAHTAGWSPDRQVRLVDLFAENVRRYSIGQPLINVVDKVAGF